MSSTKEASIFMGKITQKNYISSKTQGTNSLWKRCSTYLKSWQSMRLLECLKLIGWILHGNICLWSAMKKLSVSRVLVNVFSDSVLCLGNVNQNPTSNSVWDEELNCIKDSPQYRTLDTIDAESMEFELKIFPGFTTLQLINKVLEFMSKLDDASELKKERIIFMSMFNDIIWRTEDIEQEYESNTNFFPSMQKGSQQDVSHSSDLNQKRSNILLILTDHKENGTESLNRFMIRFGKKRTPSFPCHESSVPRSAQKQRRWKFNNTLLCWWGYEWNWFFANLFLLSSSVSTGQSQICVMNTGPVKQEHCSSQQVCW